MVKIRLENREKRKIWLITLLICLWSRKKKTKMTKLIKEKERVEAKYLMIVSSMLVQTTVLTILLTTKSTI